MYPPCDVHTWSTLYRQERLDEARERRHVERTVPENGSRGLRRLRLAWRGTLASLLQRTRPAD